MGPLASALRRYGGVLVAPRRTVARLDRDAGRYDGVVLATLYVFAVGSFGLVEGAAGLVATRDLGGVLMLLSALGRLVLAPILLLVAAETLLGEGRSHRRALSLVPLLVVGVVAHELPWLGMAAPALVPEVLGGLAGLAMAWHVRPVIEPDPDPKGAS